MKDAEDKITQKEMIELFGETMPIEAANLLFEAPDGWTVGQVRAKLRSLRAKAPECTWQNTTHLKAPNKQS